MNDAEPCFRWKELLTAPAAGGTGQGQRGCSAEIAGFLRRHGRRPRVLVADADCPQAENTLRSVSACMADMGFDVDIAPSGIPPDRTADMAMENGDHFILVPPFSGEQAAAEDRLITRLEELKCPGVQVVQIPADVFRGLAPGHETRVGQEFMTARLAAEFGPRLSRVPLECFSEQDCVRGLLSHSRQVLAQVISLLESRLAAHRQLAEEVVRQMLPHTGKAMRIGVSGVPGVGKSTFIERFVAGLVNRGHRVAVLAVDPSSLKSGGSIMGDKTRMSRLCRMPEVFIRPSPSGGALGGVTSRTRESMAVCEAAGFDVIVVETVGVGQSETAVASMVDFFLVLMLAGAGDEIQGIKKGILELADAVAVNKADGENVERAEEARKDYESALSLILPPYRGWRPVVLTCSAKTGAGLDDIWDVICRHHTALQASGELREKKRKQSVAWMWDLLAEGLRQRFYHNPRVGAQLKKTAGLVAGGRCLPTEGALKLLSLMEK